MSQNFADGVLVCTPHESSHDGQSFHRYRKKRSYLNEHGQNAFFERLAEEHRQFVEALNTIGIRTHAVTPEYRLPDDSCVCDSAIVVDNCVILPRMGAKSRRQETRALKPFFDSLDSQQFEIKAPCKLEGGDILTFQVNGKWGSLLGKRPSYMSPPKLDVRSNSEGRKFYREVAEQSYGENYVGAATCRHRALHLGTAMEIIQAAPGEPIIVHHNKWLLKPGRVKEKIQNMFGLGDKDVVCREVPKGETWAAPVLAHDGKVIVDTRFEGTARWLQDQGFEVIGVNLMHFELLDTNMRCLLQPQPQCMVKNSVSLERSHSATEERPVETHPA